MLASRFKLKKNHFALLSRPEKIIRDQFFDIKFFANPESWSGQYSVIVSKKIFKASVVRHKIKRQFYSIIEQYLKLKTNNSILIFYPKPESKKCLFSVLREKIFNFYPK